MRDRVIKAGPYILLGAVLAVLIVLNCFYQLHWLDSDMAAEMMFSKLLAEEGRIFATPNWYYSTEFRLLYTQLVMGPLFRLTDDWHLIRTVTNLVFYALLLASYYYFMRPLRVRKGLTVLTSVLLLLPFSETMMTHMQIGNTYMSHVILVFLFFGMYLRLTTGSVKRGFRAVLLILYCLLGLVCGLSGVRYLLALQCPLFLTSFWFLLRAESFGDFRREMTGERWRRIWKGREAVFFGYGALGAFTGVMGYLINVAYVSRQYVFQTYDATNFIALYQGELFERIQNAFGCLVMLFGYIPERGFLSLRGAVSLAAFVMLGLLIYCVRRSYLARGKRSADVRLFIVLFVITAFVMNVFVFVFTTSTMVPRYYITIFIFALPALAFYMEDEEPAFDKMTVAVLLGMCLLLATSKTVFSFIGTDKNADKYEVAAFLKENGYHFGFATYTNGNIITEITGGTVEIGNVNGPEYLEYFKWSSPMKYYQEDYPEGKVFLLVTAAEETEFSGEKALLSGEKVYGDGSYSVYLYDSIQAFRESAKTRE